MESSADDTSIGLLLASADDGQPVLADLLPEEAVWAAPRSDRENRRAAPGMRFAEATRSAPDADPNALRAQQWGVVAPRGEEGKRLLAAIAPLLGLRADQQGAEPRVYEVEANMDAEASHRFREEVYAAEDVPEHERPRYLLILGDLHQVSIELQQALAHGAFVGRIHFSNGAGEADLDGYRAYAEKVVRWAERAWRAEARVEQPDALFFTVHDGTTATTLGHEQLVKPCLSAAEAWRARGTFPAKRVAEIPEEQGGATALLRGAAGPRPAVLLSVSHGLGAPAGGWRSAADQRAMQGAISLGRGAALTAKDVRSAPFLPGGMWFCLACFGAGTPPASAFHAWLSLLASQGAARASMVDAVLKALPRAGERPFVAALPQAALANPDGPLGVIGHIDLAWAYAFRGGRALGESRASRILSSLKVLVNGSCAGVALDALMRSYRETNEVLMAMYQAEEDARARGRTAAVDPAQRGRLWMLRNDLRGYVLLGDPAARIALGGR